MDSRTGSTGGVVGDESVVSTVESVGVEAVVGPVDEVLSREPDWVVAVGDDALSAVVRAAPTVPVLAVDADDGVPAVHRAELAEALATVVDGEAFETTRRVFAATVDGESTGRFLRDAMLITDEAARISEYSVLSGDLLVAQLRADGVIVATPAGSPGYLRAAGGPVIEPGTGTLGALPVAPFETASRHWVLDDDAVSLSVHRDEPVVLVTDGQERRRVPEGVPVDVRPAGELRLLATGGDWKNSNGARTE